MRSSQPDKIAHTTFRGVQALRALAAVMVVTYHATVQWHLRVSGGTGGNTWENGASGVDIFFVISGFVMALSTHGKEGGPHPARKFMAHRLVRIFPLYWIVTVAVLLKEIALHQPQFANLEVTRLATPMGYIISSLLLIPYRNSLGFVAPILGVGWTLCFEMFFYYLFSVALALRIRVISFVAPVMIILSIAGIFHRASWPAVTVLLDPLLLEFVAGLLIGQLVIKKIRLSPVLCLFLGIGSLAMLFFVPVVDGTWARVTEWGIPAAVLVGAVVMLEERIGKNWPRWTLQLGAASYSLYLIHALVQLIVGVSLSRWHFWKAHAGSLCAEILWVFILSIICISGSVFLYQLVERPLNGKLRRLTPRM